MLLGRKTESQFHLISLQIGILEGNELKEVIKSYLFICAALRNKTCVKGIVCETGDRWFSSLMHMLTLLVHAVNQLSINTSVYLGCSRNVLWTT